MFFLQTAASPDFWSVLLSGVERIGIAAAMALALLWIGYKIMSGVMKTRETERKELMEMIKTKDITLNNHIDHLEKATNENNAKIEASIKALDSFGDRIVDAIHAQTELLKEIIRKR